jgi:hypothetical protein
MGIQEIIAYMGPVDVATGQRGPGASKDRRESEEKGGADRLTVSREAKTLYESDQTRKFDAMRERVRMGYYMKKEVLDQVLDSMMKDFGMVENGTNRPLAS